MSEVVIYENPGNKAARLERENFQLKAENRQLRQRLGEVSGEEIVSQVVSQAPALPKQQTFTHGACSVTIGKKAGKQATAIPSLEQQSPNEPQVQIYNAAADATDEAIASTPRVARPAKRIGMPGAPAGGGGSAVFDLASMKPVPVKPRLDDSEQRFSMLELSELSELGELGELNQQKQNSGKAG